jgi:hypothetical protein
MFVASNSAVTLSLKSRPNDDVNFSKFACHFFLPILDISMPVLQQCSKTVQDRAGQCRTVQDSAGQCRTEHGRAWQCRTLQNTAGQSRAVQDSAGHCRTLQNRTRQSSDSDSKTGQCWLKEVSA